MQLALPTSCHHPNQPTGKDFLCHSAKALKCPASARTQHDRSARYAHNAMPHAKSDSRHSCSSCGLQCTTAWCSTAVVSSSWGRLHLLFSSRAAERGARHSHILLCGPITSAGQVVVAFVLVQASRQGVDDVEHCRRAMMEAGGRQTAVECSAF